MANINKIQLPNGTQYDIEDAVARANIVNTLSALSDTTITNPSDGQALTYDSTTGTWVNADAGGTQEQADWEEDDTSDVAHILNRPAIRAGEGENSIIEGQIEQDDNAAEYTLAISGEAKATTFTYTTQDTLPSAIYIKQYGVAVYVRSSTSTVYRRIESLNTTNGTIKLNDNLSTSAITNGTLTIYYAYKSASGINSHAEGFLTSAKSNYSHAEGQATAALAIASHTEGSATAATGNSAHAEGTMTIATGTGSHTEGGFSISKGTRSHAEGYYTIAGSTSQHVQGKYNIEDSNDTYAHIVGNGTSDNARSNAHTLDWSGNGWYAGKVSAGTVASPAAVTNANDLTTKAYVDAAVSGDSDVFWVHFTENYESAEHELVADKTFAELTAAYNSGKFIQATYYGNIYQMRNTLDDGQEDFAYFKLTESSSAGGSIESDSGYFTVNTNYIEWSHGENSDDITFGYYNDTAPCMEYPPYPTGYTNGQILQYNSTSKKWEATNLPSIPTASTTLPVVDGTAAIGSSTAYAKADHVHPTDTSRAPVNSPALTGTPTAPTAAAGTNTTQIATTQFVNSAVSSALTSVMTYKGTKATVAALPSSGNTVGDVWHVTADGGEYAWDGSTWQELGTSDKDVMAVTIFRDQEQSSVLHADKTYAEISSHLNNGGAAVLRIDTTDPEGSFVFYATVYDSLYGIVFSYNWTYKYYPDPQDPYNFELWIDIASIIIHTDNTIEFLWHTNGPIAPNPASSLPIADGTATIGTSYDFARADHVHPSDSTKANVTDVLTKTNTTAFTPTADYQPATKKYVDDHSSSGVTYQLSMTNNVITLTGSDSSTSSVTLPIYNGSVSAVTGATGGTS